MNITEKIANAVEYSNLSHNLSRHTHFFFVELWERTSRLGLPPYEWWSEALHGVAALLGVSYARSGNFSSPTSFANSILLAAAFNDKMIEGIGDVIRTEERAFANVGEAGLDFWFVSSSLLKVQVLKRSPLGQRDGDIMRTSFSNSKLCEAPITRTGKGQKSTLQESRC